MLKMVAGSPIAKIISSSGDEVETHIERPSAFKTYIESAMEFYQWVHSDPESREEAQKANQAQEKMVADELTRI